MRSWIAAAVLMLSVPALFASADLTITAVTHPGTTVLAGAQSLVEFAVTNDGRDVASGVMIVISAIGDTVTGQCASGCFIPDIQPGERSLFSFSHQFPDVPGDVTFTVTVRSATEIPGSGTHSAFVTVTVSPDPDVVIILSSPGQSDLALPFPISIDAFNESAIVAHDVDITVDFRPDVGVKSLPSGCSNPAAGRVVCRAEALPRFVSGTTVQPLFVVTLIAPPTYGDGDISFTATAVERETDYDPASNTARAFTPLFQTVYVTTAADDGPGSLRQTILDANAAPPGPLTIAFRIDEPSPTPWKTIHVASPLPALTALGVRIEGATQTGFFGDTNPDGPEIEISGDSTVEGDGLVIAGCFDRIGNLAIGGFRGNGISLTTASQPPCNSTADYTTELHDLFLGTDPTGATAHPNGRGVGISEPYGTDANAVFEPATIHDCIISGNTHSGIFALSGRVNIWGNRIGVKAHSDEPLPNGASGVFIGPGCWGSSIGADSLIPATPGNVIAFNHETGVGIATSAGEVSVRGNRIWSNGLLGIDIGLDGPSGAAGGAIDAPALTLAHYDPASNKTIIEGSFPGLAVDLYAIDLYANDAADPSGFGEAQRPIASTTSEDIFPPSTLFHIEVDGNLTGQFITATATHITFGKQPGTDQGVTLGQTSELGRPIEVR